MRKVVKHPSDAGMQIARIYSRVLFRLMPNELKAVLVVGSNALGMALPRSDVDIVVIKDCPKGVEAKLTLNNDPIVRAFSEAEAKMGLKLRHLPTVISVEEFLKLKNLKYRTNLRHTGFAVEQIREGARVVFVKKNFQAKCNSVLRAQRYKERMPTLLSRYVFRMNLQERQLLREKWKKRIKSLVRK
jgi:hypothetical protein